MAMNQPKYSKPEIERRWLVDKERCPALSESRARRIDDKYLSGGRLRLRMVSEAGCIPIYKLGKKYLRQTELAEPVVSIYLTEAEYNALVVLPGRSATKTRYTVANGALDVYERPPHKLAVFEVEFANLSAASAYEPPSFVGWEVTQNEDYSGFALCEEAPSQETPTK
jgi:CYTH domain-containing protein